MTETPGCQMWGIIGRLYAEMEITDNEFTAIKRRLFAFLPEMKDAGFDYTAIQSIKSRDQLKFSLQQLDQTDVAKIFV